MDPRDYIDDFEGREEPKAELLDCTGCGARVPELTWIGNGWDYMGCPQCVKDAAAADLAETGWRPHRIEIQPVRLVHTAQGNLFGKEVA